MNQAETDVKGIKRRGGTNDAITQLKLEAEAKEKAERPQTGDSDAGGGGGGDESPDRKQDVASPGAASPERAQSPASPGRTSRRGRAVQPATTQRKPFDPLRYDRKVKLTGRYLPGFEDMT